MGMVCGAAAAATTPATAAAAAATAAAAAAADVLLCAQGEPLYNWRNVKTAVKAMLHGLRAYTTEMWRISRAWPSLTPSQATV